MTAMIDPFDPRAQPLTPWPSDPNATPGSYEDYSDQRPGLSRSARREQRRPWSPRPSENWADELAACEMGGAR